MKWICPNDQKYNNALFFDITGDGPRQPWPLYKDLACPRCMKVREAAAIERGIDPAFKLRLSGDVCCTDDGVYAFSQAAREFFEGSGISGLSYVPIPKENRYVLVFATVFAPMPRTFGSLRYENVCPECGRWSWIGFGPKGLSLSEPHDEMVVFSPDTWLENAFARTATLLCSEKVGQLLVDAKRCKALQKFSLVDL